MQGIYGIKIANKWYIGSSKNIEFRVQTHLKQLEKGTHFNNKIQESYNEDKNFKSEILMEVKKQSDLERFENYYIGKYNSIDGGYNKRIAQRNNTYAGRYIIKNIISEETEILSEKEMADFLKVELEIFYTLLDFQEFPRIEIMPGVYRFYKQEVIKWFHDLREGNESNY